MKISNERKFADDRFGPPFGSVAGYPIAVAAAMSWKRYWNLAPRHPAGNRTAIRPSSGCPKFRSDG